MIFNLILTHLLNNNVPVQTEINKNNLPIQYVITSYYTLYLSFAVEIKLIQNTFINLLPSLFMENPILEAELQDICTFRKSIIDSFQKIQFQISNVNFTSLRLQTFSYSTPTVTVLNQIFPLILTPSPHSKIRPSTISHIKMISQLTENQNDKYFKNRTV